MAQTRGSRLKAFFVGLSALTGLIVVLAANARRPDRVESIGEADARPVDRSEPRPVMAAMDGEPAAPESTADSAPGDADAGRSEAELQLVRDRLAVLEQQLAQARTDSRTELLQDLDDQVARAGEQRARQQAREEARAAEAEQRRTERGEAIDALLEVSQRLATGDSDVLEALAGASPALPVPAQMAVDTARVAIDSENLFAARYWIWVAIDESEQTELGR
jgi:hypothetical protein